MQRSAEAQACHWDSGPGESTVSGRGRWTELPGPEHEGKDACCGGGRGLFL